MAQNKNLHTAKKAKNDEFYTQLSDIEKECYHYREHFRNKVIYCNCDDARESNFFKYFAMNFEFFGLKKLITTGFKADGKGVCLVYEGDKNGNRIADDCEIQVTELQGNGDFRSEECIELLKQADIVVACVGKPEFVKREWLKEGVIILDAGYNQGNIGDVEKSAYEIASAYTPVPGGVGPMTINMLLTQTVESFRKKMAKKN
jgi:hypothetical protein